MEDIPQEKKSDCSDISPTWKGTLLSSPQLMMDMKGITTVAVTIWEEI